MSTPEGVLRELLDFTSTDKDEVAAANVRLRAALGLLNTVDDGDQDEAHIPEAGEGELVIRVSAP